MQQSKQKPFNVGDKIYCLIYGEGIVSSTAVGTHEDSMTVTFEHHVKQYFRSGKLTTLANQTVFHTKPEVILPFNPVFVKGEEVFIKVDVCNDLEWRFLTVEKEIEDRIYFKEYNNGHNYIQKKDILEIRPAGDKIEFN